MIVVEAQKQEVAEREQEAMLEREYGYYKKHKAEFDKKYDGKFIVIVGETLLGAFDTQVEAIKAATSKSHAPGEYILQFCSTSEDQTQHFRSRAAF